MGISSAAGNDGILHHPTEVLSKLHRVQRRAHLQIEETKTSLSKTFITCEGYGSVVFGVGGA